MNVPDLPNEIIWEILKMRSQSMLQGFLKATREYHIERCIAHQKRHKVCYSKVLENLRDCTDGLGMTLAQEFSVPLDPVFLYCQEALKRHVPNYTRKEFHIVNTRFTRLRRGTAQELLIWGVDEV
jgi:hypothetical protein